MKRQRGETGEKEAQDCTERRLRALDTHTPCHTPQLHAPSITHHTPPSTPYTSHSIPHTTHTPHTYHITHLNHTTNITHHTPHRHTSHTYSQIIHTNHTHTHVTHTHARPPHTCWHKARGQGSRHSCRETEVGGELKRGHVGRHRANGKRDKTRKNMFVRFAPSQRFSAESDFVPRGHQA